ncbi:hypothetical protein JCM11251_001527 [Rhodosporidiobolus azoricus]
MFALPLQPIHPLSSFVEVDLRPHHSFNLHTDFLAARRQHQRQAALEQQVRREELARRLVRQQWEEEQAALAYRAALIRRAQQDDIKRHQSAARRRHAQLREQRRREEERRRVLEARRHFNSAAPPFLDLLFHVAPVETDDKEDSQDPPEVDLTLSRSTSGSLSVESPFLPAQKPSPSTHEASLAPSEVSHITLSSDASSTVATDSDGESTSSSSDRDASLATLSTLTSSFDARRAAFSTPTTLTFQPSPSPDHRSSSPPLACTSSNASLLAYEDFLVSLLSDIDAVESYGDSSIRQTRKALVKRVEAELKRLDELKEREWERQSSTSGSEDSSFAASDEEEDFEMQEDEGESKDEQDALSGSSSFDSDDAFDESISSRNSLSHHQIPFALPPKSRSPDHTAFTNETEDSLWDVDSDGYDEEEDEEDAVVEALLTRRQEHQVSSEDEGEDETVWQLYL